MKTNLNLLDIDLCKFLLSIGFDYEVEYVYNSAGNLIRLNDYTSDYKDNIPCPSVSIAMQFIRKNLDIDVFIARVGNLTMPNLGYSYIIFYKDEVEPVLADVNICCLTYEEAEMEALIEIKNTLSK